jgi:uncharacterized protein (DUF58 family)
MTSTSIAASGSAQTAPSFADPSRADRTLVDPVRIDKALASLELTVRRRLDGLLQGNHLGLVPGPGSEPGEARPYYPGDDVRRMDWSVTARTTEPHIRQTVADRELETWIVADMSASLDFGSAVCEKRDLVIAAASAVSHLTWGGGNRVGAIIAGGGGIKRVPARGGRPHVQYLLRTLATTPRSAVGKRGDLSAAIEQLRRPPRRRGLAVVISDFVGPVDWQRSLRALSARHDLIAVEVLDPLDEHLPDIGLATLLDPESGRTREVQTTAALRRGFAAQAAAHRREVATALRRSGAATLTLHTERDWIADMLRFVMGRKRGWTGATASAPPVAHEGEAW